MGKRRKTPHPNKNTKKNINLSNKQYKNELNSITQLMDNFSLKDDLKCVNKIKNRIKKINKKSKRKITKNFKEITETKKYNIPLIDFEKFPVNLEVEYTDFFGKMYPKSTQDLEQMIKLIKLQYDRIKSETITSLHFTEMFYTLKKAVLNLGKIISFFIYEESLMKIINLIEHIQKREIYTSPYFNNEMSYMNNQLLNSLEKSYFKLIEIISNKKIQERYLISLEKTLENYSNTKDSNKNYFIVLKEPSFNIEENISNEDFDIFVNDQFKKLNIV